VKVSIRGQLCSVCDEAKQGASGTNISISAKASCSKNISHVDHSSVVNTITNKIQKSPIQEIQRKAATTSQSSQMSQTHNRQEYQGRKSSNDFSFSEIFRYFIHVIGQMCNVSA
ncbi:conserved hypothetical protein, partial [Trichinella spiralis]|uniref:hypothetical protein n=1 Tax=Trichinella spiralis TaxID=6334 RepID=UPI0001EFE833